MYLRRAINAKGEVASEKARTFASNTNPGWSMGSITDGCEEATFQRFAVLMFQHETELEGYVKQFGTDTHRSAFNAWDNLYTKLLNEAGIADS